MEMFSPLPATVTAALLSLAMDKTSHLSRLCRCPLSSRCSLAAFPCPLLPAPPLLPWLPWGPGGAQPTHPGMSQRGQAQSPATCPPPLLRVGLLQVFRFRG